MCGMCEKDTQRLNTICFKKSIYSKVHPFADRHPDSFCTYSHEKLAIPYSLLIEATASAGGVAMFGERVCDLSVQLVSQGPRYTFPGYNDDDDDSIVTAMACTLPHQTQQLLFLAASTDHLTGNKACELRTQKSNKVKYNFMFQELLVVPAFGQQMSSTPIHFDIVTNQT